MKQIYQSILIISLLLLSSTIAISVHIKTKEINVESICADQLDILITSTKDPFYSIISTPLACSYDENNQYLRPLLLTNDKKLDAKQISFVSSVESSDDILSIGVKPTNIQSTSFTGQPIELSHKIATSYFKNSKKALILPYNTTNMAYKISMVASPLACYHKMPILLYDSSDQFLDSIKNTLQELGTTTLYITSSFNSTSFENDYEIICMQNISQIQLQVLKTIKNKFDSLDYISITNPFDVLDQNITDIKKSTFVEELHHNALYLFGKKMIFHGTDTLTKQITVPTGIQKLSIEVTMKNSSSIFPKDMVPIFLSARLSDENGKTIAYSHSPGYKYNTTYLENLFINASGQYTLTISFFHGYRGGYFSHRGISNVRTTIVVEEEFQTMSTLHYPLVPDVSLNAAYLTSAHGGLLIADENFTLFDEQFTQIADSHSTGPWYDETLHQYNNKKVGMIINRLQENLSIAHTQQLMNGYVNGSGWLALIGDTNMIPMHYYPSNQTHLVERGLPSDNPYSLNHKLSVGRVISYSACDTSLLIARTLFYEELCGIPDEWHHTFNFVFGEGFGETGGIFHQIPYANTIESYGFKTTVYGDLRNSRQAAERNQVYDNANFVEYLGHGDWFWFTPSIYGFNSVGQSIGALHVRNWDIDRPNVILTSACLMGRVDGVPAEMSLCLSFLYAGSNAFIGATRETGQEAGLTVLEDHLILDDFSLGEALRGEKRVDKEKPTYYVRCLFGDPAFNPYDPLHGFSDQGTPYS